MTFRNLTFNIRQLERNLNDRFAAIGRADLVTNDSASDEEGNEKSLSFVEAVGRVKVLQERFRVLQSIEATRPAAQAAQAAQTQAAQTQAAATSMEARVAQLEKQLAAETDPGRRYQIAERLNRLHFGSAEVIEKELADTSDVGDATEQMAEIEKQLAAETDPAKRYELASKSNKLRFGIKTLIATAVLFGLVLTAGAQGITYWSGLTDVIASPGSGPTFTGGTNNLPANTTNSMAVRIDVPRSTNVLLFASFKLVGAGTSPVEFVITPGTESAYGTNNTTPPAHKWNIAANGTTGVAGVTNIAVAGYPYLWVISAGHNNANAATNLSLQFGSKR